jgi:signal transduction histidine kinase
MPGEVALSGTHFQTWIVPDHMYTHHKYRSCYYRLFRTWVCGMVLLCCLSQPVAAQVNPVNALHQQLAAAKDSVAYVEVLARIGKYYFQGNTDSCLWYGIRIMEISERLHYTKGIGDAWFIQSLCHAIRNNFKQAVEFEYHALEIYRSIGDSASVALALNALATWYYNYAPEKEQEAYNYWHQAMLVAREQLPKDSIYMIVLGNCLNLFGNNPGRMDTLRWVGTELRKLALKYPDGRSFFYMYAADADSLMMAGKGQAAEARINELADLAYNKGYAMIAITMYEHMDKYQQMGYPVDTIHYWEKMYQMGKQAGFSALQTGTLAKLYKYYSAGNNATKTAYYTEEIIRQVAHLQQQQSEPGVRYTDYFLKAAEQDRLQKENEVQRRTIAKKEQERNFYRFVVCIVIAGAASSLFLVVWKSQDFKKNKLDEQALNEKYLSLSEKQAALEANDDFKNKLITIIANDFRLPLQNIVDLSTQIRKGELDQTRLMERIEQIADSSRKRLAVFDNILQWIKSQLSGFVFVPRRCDIQPMMTLAMESVGTTATAKQLKMYNHIPENLAVAADPQMLQFVHRHLLNTAVTAAAEKSTLIIVARREKEGIYVSINLKAERALRGRELYWFLLEDNAQDQLAPQHDTRLMLIICKDFMIKMKGSVWATENPEDALTFTYFLPEA